MLMELIADSFSCQFVVKDSGDYSVQIIDPDVLVSWDAVEQVVSIVLYSIIALEIWKGKYLF